MSAFQPSALPGRDVAVESCDVCIVGAGIAGLNALYVASRYLSRDQKVILIDRRERVGGMWVDTYPYVRLHQPHGLFTAGNIKWTLGKDRSYLATKREVLDHFEHCLNVIKQRVQVDELFGWALESHDETDGIVRITCKSVDGHHLVVEAKRLVSLGLPALILFGVPARKDAQGSGAWDRDGVVQVALRAVRDAVGDELVVMADLCLDEYTDHGHCGVLGPAGEVLNDPTLELYQRIALAQAEAGADIVAPSGMMDGQVAAIRAALDGAGAEQVAILA